MTKVWVLERGEEGDGGGVVSVYLTFLHARIAAQEIMEKDRMNWDKIRKEITEKGKDLTDSCILKCGIYEIEVDKPEWKSWGSYGGDYVSIKEMEVL